MPFSNETDADKRLEILAKEAKNNFTLAWNGSEASLRNYKAVGEALIEAKTLRPNGYLKWAKAHLDIGKQWCANLVFLALNWLDYEQARSWAEAEGQPLGRKEFGVDGAVALIKKYRKSMDPAAHDSGDAPKRETKVSKLEAEVESLKQQLAGVMAQNALLMARIAGAVPKNPEPLDERTKDRARKESMLWRAGTTQGESAAAEERLRTMAQNRHWEFEAFLRECRIERPVNWTVAKAA
ncbi:hypothetical protein [Microvirga aerophila]|uniref:Uncharacterized protein n=1 Tax=Microvirga aerophila TaxID=670291 RepID=A0A512BVS3_9HYPH|nr:hypothetical protein [Microvirga aerophila]GEO16064.1 hypothetical protein MAE02_37600 [Microvirga aerophila]